MEEVSIGTFWIRVCACESGVARESKPERDSFEMMVNVEKDPAMQSWEKSVQDVGSSPG